MIHEITNLINTRTQGAKLIFLAMRGSQAYGTALPTSDTDYAGVYIQSLDSILGTGYIEQIADAKNDIVLYEVRRFLELLETANPTMLELLGSPDDCILIKDPVFNFILDQKDKFLTKICAKSFGGYAIQQIKKAKGQDKKNNWEAQRVTRKTPLDFCYFHIGEKSVSLSEWLVKQGYDQKNCGLSKVPHSREMFALFYDESGAEGYRGIVFEDSNDIRLTSIPKDAIFLGYVSYNQQGYSEHCKDYREYTEWLEKRNVQRWVDVESHGQKIDGKNMMHCRRLLDMALEIAQGKGVIVRRPNAQELISIRKGEVDLQSLIARADGLIQEIDQAFIESDLPYSVDKGLINELLVKIRKSIYAFD